MHSRDEPSATLICVFYMHYNGNNFDFALFIVIFMLFQYIFWAPAEASPVIIVEIELDINVNDKPITQLTS
jgi:hypothetical protein